MYRLSQRATRILHSRPNSGSQSTLLSSRPCSSPFSTTTGSLAHSDYGSGEANPGPNPSHDKEHPGPPPPDTGKTTDGKSKPTLHFEEKDDQPPSDAARKHNQEMEERFAKSHDKESVNDPKEKVHKGYWKGEGDQ